MSSLTFSGLGQSIRIRLATSSTSMIIYSGAAAFITYCSMYAFRKPFTAGTFEELSLWEVDYKILLIITQMIGYTLSKFIGIKVVSELRPNRRIKILLMLMGTSWVSLLFFAITPYPYNFMFMFFNGLPLGMIWGVVFSYLEGRKSTEVLGAIMASSFIVSSGLVKAGGRYLITDWGTSEFWMPFMTGLVFIPFLLLGIAMLHLIPAPSSEDEQFRTERIPMNKGQRKAFFNMFAPGIILSIVIYIGLTIFRDIRDNFAVEIWSELGYSNSPQILALSEILVAFGVLIIIGLAILIKNNRKAFYFNQWIILAGGIQLVILTYLFLEQLVSPLWWMVGIGFCMYLPYIAFHTMYFERWISHFRYKSNIGYLMYMSDAFGYLGSTAILFFKNFGSHAMSWLEFFTYTAFVTGLVTIALSVACMIYFNARERAMLVTKESPSPWQRGLK